MELVYGIGSFLRIYDKSSIKYIYIGIKPYSENDVSILANTLIEKSKSTRINSALYNLRDKMLKEITDKTIKSYWWKLLLIVLAPSLLAILISIIKRLMK